jgi:hypothetical protein
MLRRTTLARARKKHNGGEVVDEGDVESDRRLLRELRQPALNGGARRRRHRPEQHQVCALLCHASAPYLAASAASRFPPRTGL